MAKPNRHPEKKSMPRVSRRLEMLDTIIRAQTILDAIFESDDEEDVQVSQRRRMLSDQMLKKVMG